MISKRLWNKSIHSARKKLIKIVAILLSVLALAIVVFAITLSQYFSNGMLTGGEGLVVVGFLSAIILIIIVICLLSALRNKEIADSNAFWLIGFLLMLALVIAMMITGKSTFDTYAQALEIAPINYRLEEVYEIEASNSIEKFEIRGGGLFFAFCFHSEQHTILRVWHRTTNPAYPDLDSYATRDFILLPDESSITYISTDEEPRVEVGYFYREMPEQCDDIFLYQWTTVFVPEGTIQDIGISIN